MEIVVYTDSGVISYKVIKTCDNFAEVFAQALQNGIIRLETIEGGDLYINPLGCSAIEVRELDD